MNPYSGNQQFGGQQYFAQGQPNQGFQGGYNTLRQFGSDPQVVRQHIQESLQGPQAMGMNNFGSPMHAGATNPQAVQHQIAQDLGYSQSYAGNPYAGQAQQFNQGALQQVMQAAPAQIQGQYGQQLGYAAGPSNFQQQGYSQSTLGQFGSQPQMVRQHIQSDLSQQQGAMTSEQAGAWQHGQALSYGQGIAGQTQNMGQGMQPQGAFGQFGTNPQVVRQHIQQDLNGYQ